jgi:hypothetical protein
MWSVYAHVHNVQVNSLKGPTHHISQAQELKLKDDQMLEAGSEKMQLTAQLILDNVVRWEDAQSPVCWCNKEH